jgi:hypothetical protein
MIGDQITKDFGIGLGGKRYSLPFEKALEGTEILNDPIMH